MYAEANMLSVEFVYRWSEEVSVHNIQCNTVYCTLVVKLQKSSIYRLWVAYNDAMRIFIKRRNRAGQMFVAAGICLKKYYVQMYLLT